MHVWHLGGAPWLSTELLAMRTAASIVVTAWTAAHVIELRVVQEKLHGHRWQATLVLTRASMHTHWLLRCVLVHIRRWLLLVEIGQHLLLIHILKRWLHSVLAIAIHLIWPEVHQSFIHVVSVLFVIKALVHLLIEYHMWSIGREWHMMDACMASHMPRHMHICATRRICDLLNVPQVSNLHIWLLAWVRRMKCLIVAEAI